MRNAYLTQSSGSPHLFFQIVQSKTVVLEVRAFGAATTAAQVGRSRRGTWRNVAYQGLEGRLVLLCCHVRRVEVRREALLGDLVSVSSTLR